MKDLYITIAGRAATGKSTMMLMLEQFLLEKGFTVELQLENELIDYGTQNRMRQIFHENNFEREIALMNSVKITLNTKQLHFDITKNGYTQTETDNNN